MGYYVDIENINMKQYKNILKDAYMIPSRAMLKEDIDKNIDIFKSSGIDNVAQLQNLLKSKPKLKDISIKLGLDEKYLGALRLELNAYREKPTKIKDFTCLSESIKQSLENVGIKDTLQLYECVQTPNDRVELASKSKISQDDIDMITKLTDLSRIRWVNHTFAYVLLSAGYDTVEKVAQADGQKLYDEIRALNKEKQLYKGQIGLNDMILVIKLANGLPLDIKY